VRRRRERKRRCLRGGRARGSGAAVARESEWRRRESGESGEGGVVERVAMPINPW
jgi:hypothetical protein